MKVFVRSVLVSGALLMGASGLMAQTNDSWYEQWFKTKYGSYSPREQARRRAEAANTAYREEPTTETERVVPGDAWYEQWFKTKFGSYSPREQARRRAEAANTAYREEPTTEAPSPAISWREQWLKTKFGNYSPMEQARQRAARK